MECINQFKKGQYRFLSNFYQSRISIANNIFPTVEHYYQAYKSSNIQDFKYILSSPSPAIAKKRGRQIKIRRNWDFIKDYIMYSGVSTKFFTNTELGNLLISTGDSELIEGNYWGDTYWGVCLKTNQGQNKLGKILMCVREQLKETINS